MELVIQLGTRFGIFSIGFYEFCRNQNNFSAYLETSTKLGADNARLALNISEP